MTLYGLFMSFSLSDVRVVQKLSENSRSNDKRLCHGHRERDSNTLTICRWGHDSSLFCKRTLELGSRLFKARCIEFRLWSFQDKILIRRDRLLNERSKSCSGASYEWRFVTVSDYIAALLGIINDGLMQISLQNRWQMVTYKELRICSKNVGTNFQLMQKFWPIKISGQEQAIGHSTPIRSSRSSPKCLTGETTVTWSKPLRSCACRKKLLASAL